MFNVSRELIIYTGQTFSPKLFNTILTLSYTFNGIGGELRTFCPSLVSARMF